MDTNNDPFSRAMSQWDLETLYLDLASVKGKRLTPTEKKHWLFWFSCVNFCYELKQANSLSRRCSKLVNP
jgi:hypothetical protein